MVWVRKTIQCFRAASGRGALARTGQTQKGLGGLPELGWPIRCNALKKVLCKRKKKCKIETFAKTEFLKRIDFSSELSALSRLSAFSKIYQKFEFLEKSLKIRDKRDKRDKPNYLWNSYKVSPAAMRPFTFPNHNAASSAAAAVLFKLFKLM